MKTIPREDARFKLWKESAAMLEQSIDVAKPLPWSIPHVKTSELTVLIHNRTLSGLTEQRGVMLGFWDQDMFYVTDADEVAAQRYRLGSIVPLAQVGIARARLVAVLSGTPIVEGLCLSTRGGADTAQGVLRALADVIVQMAASGDTQDPHLAQSQARPRTAALKVA